MANKKIKIKLLRENSKMPESKNGNWYDTYVSSIQIFKSVHSGGYPYRIPVGLPPAMSEIITEGSAQYSEGDLVVVGLGFAADVGKGYEGHGLPRSSVFEKKGLLLTNSMGIIDDSFSGNGDEWKGKFYATQSGRVKIGERLIQITVEKSKKLEFEPVDDLGNVDRGGYGTSGD